jgi:uncharacterized phage-associated protein
MCKIFVKENTSISYTPLSEEEKKIIETNETKNRLQVLKYIINNLSNPDYYKVLKILFFADKIHIYKYDELIVPDRYVKLEHGPVPSFCYDIFRLITDQDLYNSYVDRHKYVELVKEEIKHLGDKIIKSITSIDFEYLSDSHRECLDQSIKEYKDKSFSELRKLTHDDIYDSVNMNDEITIFHIARGLDKSGELEKRLHEIYYQGK